MSSSAPLPTPRQLLTSLLNAIGDVPIPPHDAEGTRPQAAQGHTSLDKPASTSAHPLRLIHPSRRPLFATLHVLFPALLLPALDLFDRRLVTRLVLPPRKGEDAGAGKPPAGDEGVGQEQQAQRQAQRESLPRSVYLVRSAQTTTTARRPYGGGGGFATTTETPTGQAYIVHAEAWNCTCAAFAFAAFPAGTTAPAAAAVRETGSSKGPDGGRAREDAEGEPRPEDPDGEAGWEFGGLSSDGLGGDGSDGVPCCKHLLACVLAERWVGGLGTYVVERVVTKEEMAGIVADI